MTRFKRTTWFLAFMVMTFSMLGGPASLICIGCTQTPVELGACCCEGEGVDSDGSGSDRDPALPDGEDSCTDCFDLVFRLEETPVEKNNIEPAPVVFLYITPLLKPTSGVGQTTTRNHSGRPPDFSPPLRFARTVRLLI